MKSFAFLALGAALAACSSDTTTPAPTTTSTGNDAGSGTPDAGSTGTTTTGTVNGCTDADFNATAGANGGDFTSFGGADISFPSTASPTQYTNHCVKVKVGAKVSFQGSFTDHPLVPSGGDAATPITATSTGTDASFTFTTAGTFGYHCSIHPTFMFGAVRVVP